MYLLLYTTPQHLVLSLHGIWSRLPLSTVCLTSKRACHLDQQARLYDLVWSASLQTTHVATKTHQQPTKPHEKKHKYFLKPFTINSRLRRALLVCCSGKNCWHLDPGTSYGANPPKIVAMPITFKISNRMQVPTGRRHIIQGFHNCDCNVCFVPLAPRGAAWSRLLQRGGTPI